jgi:hypothetical protein
MTAYIKVFTILVPMPDIVPRTFPDICTGKPR